MKLLQWLHQLLMEKTSFSYLAAYLDALQALRAQVPQLVDRLVARSGGGGRTADSLGLLLRRPWDPVAPFLSQHKPVGGRIVQTVQGPGCRFGCWDQSCIA